MGGARRFEPVEHTADKAIMAYGGTLEELFENAALGMFSLVAEIEGMEAKGVDEIEVRAESGDLDRLLHDFLSELLFRHEVDGKIYTRIEIEELNCEEGRLRARASFVPLDEVREKVFGYVKAVTYHGLSVERHGEEWRAKVVFDT